MTRTGDGDLDTQLAERVGRLLVSGTDEQLRLPVAEDRSFSAVEARLARRGRRARLGQLSLALMALFAAGVGAYWGHARRIDRADEVITYRVGDGPGRREGELVADASAAPAPLVSFSDGTRIQMQPHMRGRVVRLDQHGGRIAVEQGRAHVYVEHRENARWVFEAGPFQVQVHGTAFSIAWDRATAHFDLQMESGVVSVTGPLQGGTRVLRAGEAMSVSVGGEPAEAPPRVEPPGAVRRPATTGGAATMASRMAADWRAELAEGNARAVVDDARRHGIERVLQSAASEDLAALADAARYVGDQALARRALHAQRRRFPRSARGVEASFLLGRLEDERADGARRALGWYDRYLAEAPAGAYASEAMGRKMMVLERAHHRDEAIRIAADYLRRFPSGSYAHAAQVLAGHPAEGSPRSP